jgi:L-alanine-DL-glutamate epimerase-like enolase superfamily enzyme
MGYPAFKTHTWAGTGAEDIEREVDTIHTVGERVGEKMQLMHDPVCEYETFMDALRVGRACDEEEFYWYEDPLADTGKSQHAHKMLRQRLQTALLQGEKVRGLEHHTDFLKSEATDLIRSDPDWDSGITGAMKIARVAEGFGVDVEFHLSGPARRHCMAATRNSNYYELGLVHPEVSTPHVHPPIYDDGYTDDIESIASDGTLPVPSEPGLGVTYDWDYIHDNSTEKKVYE